MQLPTLGQDPQQSYYQEPAQDDKKKILLMGGGGLLIIILLLLVLFSGGNKTGQQNMRSALQSTSDALGVIDEYDSKLKDTPTENKVALAQILLRGNFQALNEIYTKTYKPKKKFPTSPKADKASIETLDRADRNNTLDDEITKVLAVKVKSANQKLLLIKPSFKKANTRASINKSISDMNSIEELLSEPQ